MAVSVQNFTFDKTFKVNILKLAPSSSSAPMLQIEHTSVTLQMAQEISNHLTTCVSLNSKT